jgi:hypothetical protein
MLLRAPKLHLFDCKWERDANNSKQKKRRHMLVLGKLHSQL